MGSLTDLLKAPLKETPKPVPKPKPEVLKPAPEAEEPSGGATISLDQRRIWETIFLLTFGHRAQGSTIPALKKEFYQKLTEKFRSEGVI